MLKPGAVCLTVAFLDEAMLVPVVETFVFLGRDLFADGDGRYYFEPAEAHFSPRSRKQGSRRATGLLAPTAHGLSNIYDVAAACEVLKRCAARRKQTGSARRK